MKLRSSLKFVLTCLILPPCGAFSQPPGNAAARPASRPEDTAQPRVTRVYTLEQASAGSIAKTISRALPEVVCVPEEARNAIVAKISSLLPGDRDSTAFKVRKGEYRFFCALSNHEELGMYGTLTVR